MSHDLVIKGGTIVTATDTFQADLGIADGRIETIARELPEGRRSIDATGRLVLPGGVDAHGHVDQIASSGVRNADDFYSATVSAAAGGTTTIMPFVAPQEGETLEQAVESYKARAEGRAIGDYAFHVIIRNPAEPGLADKLAAMAADGMMSVKIYLTYDALKVSDGEAIRVMRAAARLGILVMVHAESHDLIASLTSDLLEAGHTAPKYHALSRPEATEREAVHRVLSMAEVTGAELFVVHVSTREAAEQIRWARDKGIRISAETCPQYLVFTADVLDQPGFEGAKYCCSPPPRDIASQEALWTGLRNGVFDLVSSDHSSYRYDDPAGKKVNGEDASFNRIPYGMPGLETRMPVMFSHGVRAGRLGLNRFVELCCTAPAKMYGLYPQKGTIAVGTDADIAIWDPERSVMITQSMLHDRMDYTPLEGWRLTGWPEVVISRGSVVVEDGVVHGTAGRGRRLHADRRRPGPVTLD